MPEIAFFKSQKKTQMYILDLETIITEVKITEHHSVALLKGHLCIPILLDFPEHLKLLTKCLFELLPFHVNFPSLQPLSCSLSKTHCS